MDAEGSRRHQRLDAQHVRSAMSAIRLMELMIAYLDRTALLAIFWASSRCAGRLQRVCPTWRSPDSVNALLSPRHFMDAKKRAHGE